MSGHKRSKYRAEHPGELVTPGQADSSQINVNDVERRYSLLGGAVLAGYGLLRGSLSGLALAAIGGGLIYRGVTGHCHMYETLEFSSADAGDDRQSRGHRQGGNANQRNEPAIT